MPAWGPGLERVESHPDGEWVVRPVTGADAAKAYRCPGCDHEVPARTPHLVTWPVGDVGDRRHWHTPCWAARGRRSAAGPRLRARGRRSGPPRRA